MILPGRIVISREDGTIAAAIEADRIVAVVIVDGETQVWMEGGHKVRVTDSVEKFTALIDKALGVRSEAVK